MASKILKSKVSFLMRRYRLKYGMSQEDLAYYLGVSVEQVNRWEKCRHLPRKRFIEEMRKKGILLLCLTFLTCSLGWGEEDQELIKKYLQRLGQPVLVHISNEYGVDKPNHYYVQYFVGDSLVMGLRRDKNFIDLLDEIVADIKERDYGIKIDSYPRPFFEYPPEELMKNEEERKKYFIWRRLMEIEIEKDFEKRYDDSK